jgi:hypothetical protein
MISVLAMIGAACVVGAIVDEVRAALSLRRPALGRLVTTTTTKEQP